MSDISNISTDILYEIIKELNFFSVIRFLKTNKTFSSLMRSEKGQYIIHQLKDMYIDEFVETDSGIRFHDYLYDQIKPNIDSDVLYQYNMYMIDAIEIFINQYPIVFRLIYFHNFNPHFDYKLSLHDYLKLYPDNIVHIIYDITYTNFYNDFLGIQKEKIKEFLNENVWILYKLDKIG